VGKTTLINHFIKQSRKKVVFYNGDNLSVQRQFSVSDVNNLAPLVAGYDILVIDEAQNIENIGQSLKILNDQQPKLAIVATGSAAFELRGQVGEPLVGRKTTIFLYPLSVAEILASRTDKPGQIVWQELQEQLLIYGMYPNSFLAKNNKERGEFLLELVDSLLLKDILKFQEVKGSQALLKLLRLLAFQIGSEVSMEELGNNLGISKNTVVRYVDLLVKSYVIFPLSGFSRNLRSEINKMSKYYFYDVGVRNALINNFNTLQMRDDGGKLWENWALVERMKKQLYQQKQVNSYFWRTWSGQEIDLVEEQNGRLAAWEFKISAKNVSCPKEFKNNYPDSSFQVVSRENLLAAVMPVRIESLSANRDANSYRVYFYNQAGSQQSVVMHFSGSLLATWENKQVDFGQLRDDVAERLARVRGKEGAGNEEFEFTTYDAEDPASFLQSLEDFPENFVMKNN
jgi:predicted AAA+ superfamily ATPase